MAFFLRCHTPLIAEVTEAALEAECVDHVRNGGDFGLAFDSPFALTSCDFGLLDSFHCPYPLGQNLMGWQFVVDLDKDKIANTVRKLALPALYKREIPLLKTFASGYVPAQRPANQETPSALLLGRESAFGHMASIIPDGYEIIGAYNESIAEDFLHSKPFSAVVLDKDYMALQDMRLFRALQMHPDLTNIPIFIMGNFDLDEAIYAQKQGQTLVCPAHWPREILMQAVENTVYFSQSMNALKQELQAIQGFQRQQQERLFSPLIQKLFMSSLETRLKLARHGIARGTAIILDLDLYPYNNPQQSLSKETETHYHISKQIYDLLQHLSRAEDQIFPISEKRIAIILPGTTPEGAMAAGGRYKAILQSSRFRGGQIQPDHFDEIGVYAQVHCIPLDQKFAAHIGAQSQAATA